MWRWFLLPTDWQTNVYLHAWHHISKHQTLLEIPFNSWVVGCPFGGWLEYLYSVFICLPTNSLVILHRTPFSDLTRLHLFFLLHFHECPFLPFLMWGFLHFHFSHSIYLRDLISVFLFCLTYIFIFSLLFFPPSVQLLLNPYKYCFFNTICFIPFLWEGFSHEHSVLTHKYVKKAKKRKNK